MEAEMLQFIKGIIDRIESEVTDTTIMRATDKKTGEDTVIKIKPRLEWDKNGNDKSQ